MKGKDVVMVLRICVWFVAWLTAARLMADSSSVYLWSNCENFSVSQCPGENVNVVGSASSYLSGTRFRQTTCRNALHMEDNWKATISYTVTVARDMRQFEIKVAPILHSYEIGIFHYLIYDVRPSPGNVDLISECHFTYLVDENPTITVVCTRGRFPALYNYELSDNSGHRYTFSATQQEGFAGLFFMVTTAGGRDQLISYSVDTKVEWATKTPSAPTGVTATDGTYSDKVKVSWSGVGEATSYNLYRSTSSSRPSSPTWTGVTSPYSDMTAEPGVTYYYWVAAVNSAGSAVSSYDTGYRASPGPLADFEISNGVLTEYKGAGGVVTIPSSVTSIGNGAFGRCRGLTSVTIPSSVTSIGDSAFLACSGLTSVTIPSSVTSIGRAAFSSCSGLASINVNSANRYFCSIDGLLYNKDATVLICCPGGLTSVTIPSSVTSIGVDAFFGCSGLMSIAIPSSVTRICKDAFTRCGELTSVYVDQGDGDRVRGLYPGWPGAVKFIELVAKPAAPTSVTATDGTYSDKVSISWTGSSAATSYSLYRSTTSTRPSSPTWTGVTSPYSDMTAEPGVTYYYWVAAVNSAGSAVSSYDTGYRASPGPLADFEISNGVLTKYKGAGGAVTIPSSVTSIGEEAFRGCSGLTSVTIPSSVTSIGEKAFDDCRNLTAVHVDLGDADRMKGLYDWPGAVEFVEPVAKPTAPTGVTATDGAYSDKVSISWTGSRGATSYDLYRSTTSTRPSSPHWTGVTSPYSDTAAEPGVTYYYWVVAVNSAGSAVSSYDTGYRVNGGFSGAVANTYDGYMIDAEGNLVGIVQVKTTKQSVKTTTDRKTKVKTVTIDITATATVTDANGEKWSYSKGSVTVGGAVTGLKCTAKGCPVEEFGATLGRNDMEGSWGEYAIFGARNGMGIKGDEMMAALEAYKGKWSVSIAAARPEVAPYQMGESSTLRMQLNVQAKGVVKIAGNWESGAKVSASAQLVMGDGFAYVPVMIKATKTAPAVMALLKISADGTVELPSATDPARPEGAPYQMVEGGRTVDALGEPVCLPSELSAGGKAFGARVTVNELAYPVKFAAKKLPPGLKIDSATGVISGTPTKPGLYAAEVTVTSGLNPKAKQTLTVEFDIANYTDDLIPIKDVYGPYYMGVAAEEQIVAAAGCSVSGLPSGLKWTAKSILDSKTKLVKTAANTVYGVPTKACTNTVYFKKTVKEAVGGKQKTVTHQASATFIVEGMKPWAVGTFNGGSANGIVTLTVAKTGKLSGKWTSGGLTWTLSAASFDAYISSEQMYAATVIGKSGKLAMTNEIAVTESGVVACDAHGGDAASTVWEAWRNGWGAEPLKTLAKKLKGRKVQVGEVLLTVGANGAVTAKGTFVTGFDEKKQKDITYSASCSTVLIPTAKAGWYRVCLYFPPKAGKFDGFTDVVEIGLDEGQ